MMRNNSTADKRNLYIDAIKFVLSFLIIGIHVALYHENEMVYSIATHIRECAMPLFSIITGYYFSVNYSKTGNKYAVKVITHILIVYAIWATIEYVFCMTREQVRSGLVYLNIRAWLADAALYGRLWYFGSIVLFTLLMVVKKCMEKRCGEKTIDSGTAVLVVILCVLTELTSGYSEIIPQNNLFNFFHLNEVTLLFRRMILYALPFMFIGHWIHRYREVINWFEKRAAVLTVIGLLVYIVECFCVDALKVENRTMIPYAFTIFFFLWLLKNGHIRGYTKTSNYLRALSGFIYCFHAIPIYYYRTTPLIEIMGGASYMEFIFVAVSSLLLGTVLYMIMGKRMKKIVA